MSWTSSTAVVGMGTNGVISTTSNNAIINGDWSSDYLEVYGSDNTVLAGGGWDSIGAMMYPERGMNGTRVYLDGGDYSDVIIAAAVQGEQYATLVGGSGFDTLGIGCNDGSTLNVVIADLDARYDQVGFFYEGYGDGIFTCYSSDKGLIIRDNAGRLNVTLSGASDYTSLLNSGQIWVYPRGVRRESAVATAATVWQNGSWKRFGRVANYGGHIPGHVISGNTISLNDYHNGGLLTDGVYGLENIIVIDNTQSHDARFLGGNGQANYIFAGSGGDSLWGGTNNDVLIGGAGSDNFIYNAGEGVDFITNADWLDTVNIYGLNLSNAAVFGEPGAVAVVQDANNSLTIQYNGNYSPLIRLADNSTWRYNNANSSWQNV